MSGRARGGTARSTAAAERMTSLTFPYHIGILVHDLEAAAAELTETLGYTFNPPSRAPLRDFDDAVTGHRGPGEVVATYSQEGPLYLELIQMAGEGGVYGAAQGEGIHHIGFWEPDIEGRLRHLTEAGQQRPDAVSRGGDGSPSIIYTQVLPVLGVRLEYVKDSQRERLERWFRTGELS